MQVQNIYLALNYRKFYFSFSRDVIFHAKLPVWTGGQGPILLSGGILISRAMKLIDIFINFSSFYALCGTECDVRKNTFVSKMQAEIFIEKFKGIRQIG
jgi:hypothetical protein